MASPVKVTDELAEAARETAELANRSIAKQIEHWARIGRAVERLLKTDDIMALKAQLVDPSDRDTLRKARAALVRLTEALREGTAGDVARALIFSTDGPVYEAVPGRPNRVAQVWPDGRKTLGHFDGGEFVADEPSLE